MNSYVFSRPIRLVSRSILVNIEVCCLLQCMVAVAKVITACSIDYDQPHSRQGLGRVQRLAGKNSAGQSSSGRSNK